MELQTRFIKLMLAFAVGVGLVACGGAPGAGSSDGGTDGDKIEFVSMTNSVVQLQGVGSTTTSKVKFKVTDSAGVALRDVMVEFTIGSPLGDASVSPEMASTDGNGFVSTTFSSGAVAGDVRVTARLSSSASAQSNDIKIGTGFAFARRISVSVESAGYVKDGAVADGVTVDVAMTASDQLGYKPVNGTPVSIFSPTYGSFSPSQCVLQDGACFLVWSTGSGSRELLASLSVDTGNRPLVPILLTLEGAEAFVDVNKNNIYDVGEPFYDLGEPYLDENGSKTANPGDPAMIDNGYDLGEFYRDLNGNGVYDVTGNGLYDGPCIGDACEGNASAVIWGQAVLRLCLQDDEEPLCKSSTSATQ